MTEFEACAVPVRAGHHGGAGGGALTVSVVGDLVELSPDVGPGGPQHQLYLTATVSRRLAVLLLEASEGVAVAEQNTP